MIKSFIATHGTGFLLHILGAIAIMLIGWWSGVVEFHLWRVWRVDFNIAALVINTPLWPGREVKQRRWSFRAIFTTHALVEWVPAFVVGFVAFGVQMAVH